MSNTFMFWFAAITASVSAVAGVVCLIWSMRRLVREGWMSSMWLFATAVVLLFLILPSSMQIGDFQKWLTQTGDFGTFVNGLIPKLKVCGIIALILLALYNLVLAFLALTKYYNVWRLQVIDPATVAAKRQQAVANITSRIAVLQAEETAFNAAAAAAPTDAAAAARAAAKREEVLAAQAQLVVAQQLIGQPIPQPERQTGECILHAFLAVALGVLAAWFISMVLTRPLPQFVALNEAVQKIEDERIRSSMDPVFRFGQPAEFLSAEEYGKWLKRTQDAVQAYGYSYKVNKLLYVTTESDKDMRKIFLFVVRFDTEKNGVQTLQIFTPDMTEEDSAQWAEDTLVSVNRLGNKLRKIKAEAKPDIATGRFHREKADRPPQIGGVLPDQD